MRRTERACDHLKTLGAIRDIAHTTAGYHPKAAQPFVDIRLDLSPERAESGRLVEVFDHRDRRFRPFVDVLVVVEPLLLHDGGVALRRCFGPNTGGPRVSHDRCQGRAGANHRLGGVAVAAAFRRHDLQRIAHRRCVQRRQCR